MTSHNYDKVRIESCNYAEKVAITRDRVIITIVEIMRNCRNCMLQLLQKSLQWDTKSHCKMQVTIWKHEVTIAINLQLQEIKKQEI